VFRAAEKSLATPPRGRISKTLSLRKRRRLEAVMLRLEAVSGRS
jgi:hypothetical protein